MRKNIAIVVVVVAMLIVGREAVAQEPEAQPEIQQNQPQPEVAPSEAPVDLAGLYLFQGIYRDGKTYRGLLKIIQVGKDVYGLRWSIADKAVVGIGILKGDFLAVGLVSSGVVGVGSYRLNGSGLPIVGTWTDTEEDGKTYIEIWQRFEHPEIQESEPEPTQETEPEAPAQPASKPIRKVIPA